MRFPHPFVKNNPNKALLNLNKQSRYVNKYINRSPRYANDKPTPMSEEEWLKAWRNWCGAIRFRECAYLGDRIRATIGIANITRPPSIGEDFFRETAEMDVDDLYRWMSTVFITRSTNLDHLSEVGPRTRLNASWVADYARELEAGSLCDIKRFNAFPGKSLGEGSVVDKVLRVVGLQMSTIKSSGGTGDMTLPEWCLEHLFHLPEKYGWMENQSSVEALWRTLIWDTNDTLEKLDDSWAVQFKEWIESHYIIRSIFPGYRSSLSGEDTLTQAWWNRAEQQLQHAERVARTCGHPAGPSLEKIRTTACAVQQHASWQSAALLPSTIRNHAHPWDQIFVKTSEMIPDFRIVYNKAYWSPFAQRVSATLKGRTIITTPSGFLGIAHWQCAVGDEIWVLSGGRVAYALERFDPNKSRTGDPLPCDMHEFHGDCYIHGIMEGEFVISMMQSGVSELLEFLYIL